MKGINKPVVKCAFCDAPIDPDRVILSEESTAVDIKVQLVPIHGKPGIFCDCPQTYAAIREYFKEGIPK